MKWSQEVWTLCRIFKRNVSHRKYTPDWRELSNKRQQQTTTSAKKIDTSPNTCSVDSNTTRENYISFTTDQIIQFTEMKPLVNNHRVINERKLQLHSEQLNMNITHHQFPSMAASSYSNISSPFDDDELFSYNYDWDELRSVVEFALDPSHL